MPEGVPSRRLRIRLKALGPDELQAALDQVSTDQGLFVPSQRMLPLGTAVNVELLYHDGKAALRGQGTVSAMRAPPLPNPGLTVRVDWRAPEPSSRVRRFPSASVDVPSRRRGKAFRRAPQTSDLVLDVVPPVTPLFAPSSRPEANRELSATQMVIERAKSRQSRSTTYEGKGSETLEYIPPPIVPSLDDSSPLARAASTLARIHLVTSGDEPADASQGLPATGEAPTAGIDFGHGAVRAWIAPGGGRPPVAASQVHSAVYLSGEDEGPVVGAQAQGLLRQQPGNGLLRVSRFLGRAFSQSERLTASVDVTFLESRVGRLAIRVGQATRSVEGLAAELLVEARASASRALGREVRCALLACPTNYGMAARNELRRAAERAGFEVAGLVQTPVAIASELAFGGSGGFHRFLVIDFSQGFVDAAVVGVGVDAVRVLGTASTSEPYRWTERDGIIGAPSRAMRAAGVTGDELDVVALSGEDERDPEVMGALTTRICNRIVDLQDAQVAASGIARLAAGCGAPSSVTVVQKLPGALWLIDERGQMQQVVPEGADWPARGRGCHHLLNQTEQLFLAEELDGTMAPIAEVRLTTPWASGASVDAELEITARSDGSIAIEATDARTGVVLGVEVALAVGRFFEALNAAQ